MTKVFMDSADPIVIRNLEGAVIDVNHETERVFGFSREELIGRRTTHLLAPEFQEAAEAIHRGRQRLLFHPSVPAARRFEYRKQISLAFQTSSTTRSDTMKTPLFQLLLVALLLSGHCGLAQQNPDGQLPVTSIERPYLFLIRDPVVHGELKLSARQREAIDALNQELDGPLWSMRNQSAQHIADTVQQATATAKTRLSSILSRDQQQRLDQIELWTLGMKAFLRDDFQESLGLGPDQRESAVKVVTDAERSIVELAEEMQSGEPRESVEKKAKALRTDEQKQLLAILTRSQQQQWAALLGKPIDVGKLGRIRFRAPELHGGQPWINSPPLSLRQLKGKVVALHFYAFG